MLYEYIQNQYQPNEPVFVADVQLPVSDTNLRQMFKKLCDEGKIRRFDKGIYYLPSKSRLKGGAQLAPETVVRYKYIERGGRIDGYYSGFTFANQFGITTQVPYALEVVSNAASANVREVSVKGRRVVLRKPKTTVTGQNAPVLQLLDLLKDIELYADEPGEAVAARLVSYIRDAGITQEELDRCLAFYPDKVYRNRYEMRVYHAFTS